MTKSKQKAKPKAKKSKTVKTAKKQERQEEEPTNNPLEETYGPMQEIYIDQTAYERLRGNERYGKWYQVCAFGTSATKVFCFKTTVPKSALEDGQFHPDRYEPDAVAEMCERVSPKEIALQVEKNKPKPVFVKKGQKVWLAVHGAGVTSYEEHKILYIKKDKVLLEDGPNKQPFDAVTGEYLGEVGFGFSYKLLSEEPKGFKKDE